MSVLSIIFSAVLSISGVWNPWHANVNDWGENADLLADNGFDSVFLCCAFGPVIDEEGLRKCLYDCTPLGIDVHAWVVMWRIPMCSTAQQESFAGEDRLMVSSEGETYQWLCPTDPRNVQLMASTILHLAADYPVTGIHLDYIRYKDYLACFCDGCRQRFHEDTGIQVRNWPDDCFNGGEHYDDFMHWRADRMTDAVRAVRDSLSRINRIVMVSAAVMPKDREMILFGQMWNTWLAEGLIDMAIPMNYTESDSQLAVWGEKQLELADGYPLSCGIGAFSHNSTLSAGQIRRQQAIAIEMGFDGWVIFRLCSELIDQMNRSTVPAALDMQEID